MFGAIGFVYGDGTLANFGRTSMVRLCGDKTNTLVGLLALVLKFHIPNRLTGYFFYFPVMDTP